MNIIKILLKTIADNKGIKSADTGVKTHGKAVKALSITYAGFKKTGSVALKGLGVAWKGLGSVMRGVRNAAGATTAVLAVAVRESVKTNVRLAQATNMFGENRVKNFMKLRSEVMEIARETGVARGDLINALYTAGSAQFGPDKALEAVRIATRGAIADGADVRRF